MKNIENKALTYNADVTDAKLSMLTDLMNTGKNAHVLLTVGKAMRSGKDLPKWCAYLGNEHFEKVFNLSEKTLKKICETNDYAHIRTIINIHCKGEVITANQLVILDKVLTIKAFQSVDILKTIKLAYNAKLNAEQLLQVFGSFGAHTIEKEVKGLPKQHDLSVLTQTLRDLDLDQALLMMEVLQGKIAELEDHKNRKVAKVA